MMSDQRYYLDDNGATVRDSGLIYKQIGNARFRQVASPMSEYDLGIHRVSMDDIKVPPEML